MTDRERILMNIAALLAQEVCTLQRLPEIRTYLDGPHSLRGWPGMSVCKHVWTAWQLWKLAGKCFYQRECLLCHDKEQA